MGTWLRQSRIWGGRLQEGGGLDGAEKNPIWGCAQVGKDQKKHAGQDRAMVCRVAWAQPPLKAWAAHFYL